MSRLSRVHLATKELTEPRRASSPLAYQYVLFKREALAQQDRLYIRDAVERVYAWQDELMAITPQREEECIQRALLE